MGAGRTHDASRPRPDGVLSIIGTSDLHGPWPTRVPWLVRMSENSLLSWERLTPLRPSSSPAKPEQEPRHAVRPPEGWQLAIIRRCDEVHQCDVIESPTNSEDSSGSIVMTQHSFSTLVTVTIIHSSGPLWPSNTMPGRMPWR